MLSDSAGTTSALKGSTAEESSTLLSIIPSTSSGPASKTTKVENTSRTMSDGTVALGTSQTSTATALYKTIYVTKTADASSDNAQTVGQSDLTVGAIAAIAIGGFVILAVTIGTVIYCLRRRGGVRKGRALTLSKPHLFGSPSEEIKEKARSNASELNEDRSGLVYEAPGGVVHEMEAHHPHSDSKIPDMNSRSVSSESEGSRNLMIGSRHIMSRGRPVRRDQD